MFVDLVVMENGGMVVGWSDMYFGYFRNFIVFGLVVNIGEGWETVRRVRICLVVGIFFCSSFFFFNSLYCFFW